MTTTQLLSSTLAGLGLGLGLIVAIGAQNAFVLRQGIRNEHVLAVVLICIASDAALIAAGVAGAGALFTAAPSLVVLARWGGALFLLGYALLAARRALRHSDTDATTPSADATPATLAALPSPATPGLDRSASRASRTETLVVAAPAAAAGAGGRRRLPAVAGTALALTWLNPHVYLDTFVLLGSIGSSHDQGRWAFAAGAILGSTLWFTALGLAARTLAPVFARPRAWRVLDAVIAAVMTTLGIGLLLGG